VFPKADARGPGDVNVALIHSALVWPPCRCGSPKCPDYEPPSENANPAETPRRRRIRCHAGRSTHCANDLSPVEAELQSVQADAQPVTPAPASTRPLPGGPATDRCPAARGTTAGPASTVDPAPGLPPGNRLPLAVFSGPLPSCRLQVRAVVRLPVGRSRDRTRGPPDTTAEPAPRPPALNGLESKPTTPAQNIYFVQGGQGFPSTTEVRVQQQARRRSGTSFGRQSHEGGNRLPSTTPQETDPGLSPSHHHDVEGQLIKFRKTCREQIGRFPARRRDV
jgi:hypothetical protein